MSAWKCNTCGHEFTALDFTECPKCKKREHSFAAPAGSAAFLAAVDILAGSEHGSIRWYGEDSEGVWRWQHRDLHEVTEIIEKHFRVPPNSDYATGVAYPDRK